MKIAIVLATLALLAPATSSPVQATPTMPRSPYSITFSNPKAASFKVSNTIPGISFQLPTSYAGNVLISAADPSRQLFFWMFPSETPTNATVIWSNGGPGCSSMEGLLQENGPINMPRNSTEVSQNPYAWTKVANVIWVDHPVSVGFSKGPVGKMHDEDDLSRDFVGFLDNFFAIFTELKGTELWLSGESYAGKYLPYIANAIYKRSDATNAKAGLNLQGIMINDPEITDYSFYQSIPAIPFAVAHQADLKLSDEFMDKLIKEAKKYGIYDYLDKNLKYPPPGILELPDSVNWFVDYNPWNDVYDEAKKNLNGTFNPYDVRPKYSWFKMTDPLGFAHGQHVASTDNFINNVKGFKEAIHADPNIAWKECLDHSPFRKGDWSLPPDVTVMQNVIERSKRTLVQHGLQDFLLIANGTRLSIQNTTFNGLQGFQQAPHRRLIVDGRDAGVFHEERGLTYVEITGSGHMLPSYPENDAAASYKTFLYFIGKLTLDQLGK